MSNHDTSFGLPGDGRCNRWIFSIVTLSLLVASDCGLSDTALLSSASVEIIRGKDSAGATIELEKRGDDLTAARVIYVVLGTGEAKIISGEDGHIEFAIDFPAGATITYVGTVQNAGASSAQAVAGAAID